MLQILEIMSHIALATNSRDIKLYEIASMNCQLLCGHTDSILALATTPANVHCLYLQPRYLYLLIMCNNSAVKKNDLFSERANHLTTIHLKLYLCSSSLLAVYKLSIHRT